jgi:hypothetical protein
MHARTLVEMAIVRICQIGEMDDLAAVIAELRGAPVEPAPKAAPPQIQTSGGLRAGFQAQVDLKKNEPPRPVTPAVPTPAAPRSIEPAGPVATSQPISAPGPVPETAIRRDDPPHVAEAPAVEANGSSEPAGERESVLEKFKQAMAGGGLPKAEAAPPRTTRRQQLAQVAEQPFVRRAMELFDVAPEKMRYTPPEGEST